MQTVSAFHVKFCESYKESLRDVLRTECNDTVEILVILGDNYSSVDLPVHLSGKVTFAKVCQFDCNQINNMLYPADSQGVRYFHSKQL